MQPDIYYQAVCLRFECITSAPLALRTELQSVVVEVFPYDMEQPFRTPYIISRSTVNMVFKLRPDICSMAYFSCDHFSCDPEAVLLHAINHVTE